MDEWGAGYGGYQLTEERHRLSELRYDGEMAEVA
jgi:hypothetical protein